MEHSRRDCPGPAGCSFHRWPPGEPAASRQRDPGVLEYATYKGPRKAAAFQQAHTANAVRHELELLTSSAQRIMDYARTQQQRSRLDGRKVIEDRKRERRKIIGQVGRYGIGQL